MDLLKKCALGFNILLKHKYHFILGRKGKIKEFTISFDKSDFHHLAGLHKLKDNAKVQYGKRADIFDSILTGEITLEQIQKSEFYNKMENRIEPLCCLEEMLDNNNLIFHYNEKVNQYSVIKADYLLENRYFDESVFLFLGARGEDGKEQMCRTFFPKQEIDYTQGQAKYTLLKKEKINCETHEVEVQYNRLM
ncbi:MAG: hypothetical protein IJZ53_08965 [Tyzzerella sp.]|nr:hypothetical protein [Tyzzerella sp.]